MFDKLLKESDTVKKILAFVEATNKLTSSLTELVSSIVKELERQSDLINNLTILCEMIVRNDPGLQDLMKKVQEDRKKKIEGSN